MKSSERLSKLEKKEFLKWHVTDYIWLINRVKMLTEALEHYADERCYRPDGWVDVQPDLECIGKFTWKVDKGDLARKVLGDEELQ